MKPRKNAPSESYTATATAREKHYVSKTKQPVLKIVRKCLNMDCHRTFTAKSPYIRLCETHREG